MDPTSAGLLDYFVKFILSAEGQALAVDNMFVGLPQALLNYNAVTLSTITKPAGMPTFTTETAANTLAQIGAGEYVISGKRRSYDEVQLGEAMSEIAALKARIAELEAPPATTAVSFSMQASGTVDDYTPDAIALIKASIASAAGNGVSADDVVVAIAGGSVVLTVTINVPETSASAVQSSVAAQTATASNATALLASVDVGGSPAVVQTIVSAPEVTVSPPPSPPPPVGGSSTSDLSSGEICINGRCYAIDQVAMLATVGIVMGILGFLLACFGCVMSLFVCANQRSTKPRSQEIKARDIEIHGVVSSTVSDEEGGRKV